MKNACFLLAALTLVSSNATADAPPQTIMPAKVVSIQEHDSNYSKILIDRSNACGAKASHYFWLGRKSENYEQYMSVILAAKIADLEISIASYEPGWCTGDVLYNPRVGLN